MTNKKTTKDGKTPLSNTQPGNDHNVVNEQEQQNAVNPQEDTLEQHKTSEDFTSEKDMNRSAQLDEDKTPANQSTEIEDVDIDRDESSNATSTKMNP